MTKKKVEPIEVVEEPLPEEAAVPEVPLEEQDLDDIEISLKTDPNALMLPECEVHHFDFLRTAKVRGNKSSEGMQYRRIDTFFCTGCLRYTTVARDEMAKITPEWFMGN